MKKLFVIFTAIMLLYGCTYADVIDKENIPLKAYIVSATPDGAELGLAVQSFDLETYRYPEVFNSTSLLFEGVDMQALGQLPQPSRYTEYNMYEVKGYFWRVDVYQRGKGFNTYFERVPGSIPCKEIAHIKYSENGKIIIKRF